MKNTEALKQFVTEEEILSILILFESRKLAAANKLKELMWDKWQVTTLQALGILQNVSKEF